MTQPIYEYLKAKVSPTNLEIAWAAGFLEGEGCFRATTNRKNENIFCGQVNSEPVAKLRKIFGGSIAYRGQRSPKQQPYFLWTVTGARARGVMLTVFPFLSELKRNQVIKAIRARSGELQFVQRGR